MAFHHLALLSIWIAFLNAIIRPLKQDYVADGWQNIIANGLGCNFVIWFAFIIASQKLWSKPPAFANKASLFLLFVMLLFLVLPFASLSWLAASLAALSLILIYQRNSPERLAAGLLLCAALREPATNFFLKTLGGTILNADAFLTGIALNIMGYSSRIQDNIITLENGQPLLILTGCSVFTNLSYVSLLWLAIHVMQGQILSVKSWITLSILLFISTCANGFRLAFMTHSKESYLYYHDGIGADLFQWGLLAFCIFFTVMRCRYVIPAKALSHPLRD